MYVNICIHIYLYINICIYKNVCTYVDIMIVSLALLLSVFLSLFLFSVYLPMSLNHKFPIHFAKKGNVLSQDQYQV